MPDIDIETAILLHLRNKEGESKRLEQPCEREISAKLIRMLRQSGVKPPHPRRAKEE